MSMNSVFVVCLFFVLYVTFILKHRVSCLSVSGHGGSRCMRVHVKDQSKERDHVWGLGWSCLPTCFNVCDVRAAWTALERLFAVVEWPTPFPRQ